MTASFSFSKDPYHNFESLFVSAVKQIPKDPNAMFLATSTRQGVPSVRTVLFKGFVRQGFSFYTNYESQKAQEIKANKKAAALFFWAPLEIQIRVDGLVEKLTRLESEAYFKTRDRKSQLGAWASRQSQKIADHEELEKRVIELESHYAGKDIPCPENWGGYHLLPVKMEFWFGKQGRLHERYVYERETVFQAQWQTYMKSP